MDDSARFEKIGDQARLLFGPRGLLACGLEEREQEHLLGMADRLGELPVVFATEAEAEQSLGELLALPAESNQGRPSGLVRAIIMSGISEIELHMIMTAWRKLGHERPLWATVTPTSVTWPLARLLAELAEEDDRMGSS
jgi:hypothetical protein